MPSTFVHGLLPPSCLFMTRSWLPKLTRSQMFRLAVLAFVLANAPDIDLIPASLMPQYWKLIHREWGHNIFCLTAYIIFGANALMLWVSPLLNGRKAWMISSALVLSHILLDSMGQPDNLGVRPGIPLFWPLSEREFALPIRLFRNYNLDKHLNPILAHLTSQEFWTQVVVHEFLCIAVLLVMWFGIVALVSTARRITKANEEPETGSP
jgi:membrane-bound metal-dependent hydrolase YbcI (DUF457 family)